MGKKIQFFCKLFLNLKSNSIIFGLKIREEINTVF